MAGELQILDDKMEQEFLSLEAPLAFIDFEAIMNTDYLIPGTMATDTIPCQWSCHILNQHGLNWEGNLEHYEFLWTGDVGWSPIYAFVQSLYDATYDAATILIYTGYEIRCLTTCKQLALNDLNALETGQISPSYVVVDCNNHKVPLTAELVDDIIAMCDSMLDRFYDMCEKLSNKEDGTGVLRWLQSSEFKGSHSIKKLLPAAMAEYSRTEELLLYEGLPANGYAGLGGIHNGEQCTKAYGAALNRPPREGVAVWEDGNAPFDPDIEAQCLIYCRLDTLAMVIVYMAVLEATETWREEAESAIAEYARIGDDYLFHAIDLDADNQVFYTTCDTRWEYPYSYDTELEWMYDSEIANMPIEEMYTHICPECRRLRNMAARTR